MRNIIGFVSVLCLIVSFSGSIYAADRVICDVEIISDQSAEIHLRWNDDTNSVGIRITGWTLLDEDTLKITYITGANIESGFETRKIEGDKYHFPMKIILEEEGKDELSFSDMPAADEEKLSILNLYYRGIISGYGDGTFKPYNGVTRAEFAKMITATADYTLITDEASMFTDINNGYWGLPYITTLAKKGIFKGRTDGSFDPNGNITIGEVLAVINRTFILYNSNNAYPYTHSTHWSNEQFLASVKAGIVKSTDAYYNPYTPDVKATRVQCAVLLSRVLEQLHETN